MKSFLTSSEDAGSHWRPCTGPKKAIRLTCQEQPDYGPMAVRAPHELIVGHSYIFNSPFIKVKVVFLGLKRREPGALVAEYFYLSRFDGWKLDYIYLADVGLISYGEGRWNTTNHFEKTDLPPFGLAQLAQMWLEVKHRA